jgi:phosphopantetheinyl transferase (holo-ACP synthase)
MEAFCNPLSARQVDPVLGVGLDLVHVDRAARLLETHGETLLRSDLRPFPEHLATVLAAKEAFFKALGHGLAGPFDWPQVEVRAKDGATLTPRGPALAAVQARGVTHILFNIGELGNVRFVFTILWRNGHAR